jgi:hypothetical protein
MKNYNVKYCESEYCSKQIKIKLVMNVKNEIEAMYKIYEQMQGVFITAIEERKLC